MVELRVHELAKAWGLTSKIVMDRLASNGVFVKSSSSRVTHTQALELRAQLDVEQQLILEQWEAELLSHKNELTPTDPEHDQVEHTSAGAAPARVKSGATAEPASNELRDMDVEHAGLRTGSVQLAHGSVGHSFDTLLVPYLQNARNITIEDPYIRNRHQVENLADLLASVVARRHADAPVLAVNLVTSRALDPEGRARQEKWLGELNPDLDSDPLIHFSYQYSETIHDRVIVTDDGWRILIGRGLDIFQPPAPGTTTLYIRRRVHALRPVKGTNITFERARHS